MQKFKFVFKWTAVCLSLGLIGGVIGALFSHSIGLVTSFRGNNGWILYLLPLGGILSVYIPNIKNKRSNN